MLRHRWSGALFSFGTGLLLIFCNAACTATPPPASSIAAANPSARVPAVRYRSVTPAIPKWAPAEPEPWQDLNVSTARSPANSKGQEQ